jgi:hypothetical protein
MTGGIKMKLTPPDRVPALISVFVLCLLAAAMVPVRGPSFGEWTGTSLCVGERGACKDEIVVYRFEPIPNRPDHFMLFGDKILEKKRVPMGKLEFVFDPRANRLTCEFRRGYTHGLFEFKIAGDDMTGTLITLPEKTVRRDIKVHLVSASDAVPEAPPPSDYDE